MKIDNKTVAKELSKLIYYSGGFQEYCIQLFVENIVLPIELDCYTEEQLEDYIYQYLTKNNINIDTEWG